MPNNTPSLKFAYHHGDLPKQTLDLALKTLRELGDAAISLRALAKQLGVSAPALYRHFSDRDTLLAELAIGGFEALTDRLGAVDQTTPRTALIEIGLVYVKFAQEEPNLYRLMFGGRVLPLGAHPRLDAAGKRAFKVLENTVSNARQLGYLKPSPVSMTTAAAWSLVHGLSQLTIDGHLPSAKAEPTLTEGVLSLLLDGARSDTRQQSQQDSNL
ncbi:TetR/AcrR family transcriptional regulator [Marinobacter sp. 1_MG-2023]|uniref:TetR/AcrR family transcriptional regulator n=1 Tax=Marinobacter sp. 1_MG-2023 TaxID=3062627 RepID=UPI0026E2AC3A|nr:TetR/AcrR family transcriptional regulator [Marinobacter sp. 1_MG-2023]MDO6823814.1 TetR/AcrR family transcriptional regulator [Marinobacter sp. 1_MG-2023]